MELSMFVRHNRETVITVQVIFKYTHSGIEKWNLLLVITDFDWPLLTKNFGFPMMVAKKDRALPLNPKIPSLIGPPGNWRFMTCI